MMQLLRKSVLLACCALCTPWLSAQQPEQHLFAELQWSNDDYLEDFASIQQQVVANYSLAAQKHINLDSLNTLFVERVKEMNLDGNRYGMVLLDYFAALQVGHAFPLVKMRSAGGKAALVEGRLYVDGPSQIMLTTGLADKDEILSIDGVSVKEWLAATSRTMPGSTEQARLANALDLVFASYTDSVKQIAVRRGNWRVELSLPLPEVKEKQLGTQLEPMTSCTLRDSVGYIAINTMAADDMVPLFEQHLLPLSKLPYLIIDIRNNMGGNSRNGVGFMEYLTRKTQAHCLAKETTFMKPKPNGYRGRVFLLVGPRTFSAAESFAMDMRDNQAFTLVGEATAGDTGNNPRMFLSSKGIPFIIPTRKPQVSVSGFPMEGQGIPPTVEVHQSLKDFKQGRDTQLEYVLEHLGM